MSVALEKNTPDSVAFILDDDVWFFFPLNPSHVTCFLSVI